MNDAYSTNKYKNKLAKDTQHRWIWQFYSQISPMTAGHSLFMWNVNQGIHSKVTPTAAQRRAEEFLVIGLMSTIFVERFISLDQLCSNEKKMRFKCGPEWMWSGQEWSKCQKQGGDRFKGTNDVKIKTTAVWKKSSPSHVLRTSEKPGDIPRVSVSMARG